jgi:hypothetical protein
LSQLVIYLTEFEGKGVVSKTGLPEAAVALVEESQAPVSGVY